MGLSPTASRVKIGSGSRAVTLIMQTSNWASFPHDNSEFDYAGEKLATAWSELHRGDREPYPDSERILTLEPGHENPEAAAATLADAWRAYHRGDFAEAADLALSLGQLGHAVANKASGIYADYLEEDEAAKAEIYSAGIRRAEEAIQAYPDDANAHYFHAFLLGRYSQSISVAQALAQGVGGKIKSSLEKALALAPDHAEAQTAMGLYHAEIIDKVGKLVGSMTYGASADKAMKHFEKALALTPDAPIAQLEFGNGLYLLYGDKHLDESNAAYAKAAAARPIDAMQRLDVEYAKASLE
jgi:tetratricopeptide (TPR) repeat protein